MKAFTNRKVAAIHTSDRNMFKRCRRRWNWQSHLRQAYQPTESPAPLWLGIGFHFAMEDFHGYNKYGSPVEAFKAFVTAYRTATPERLPADWRDLEQMGLDMLGYYETWLQGRSKLTTYVVDGVPQTEVDFEIDIPVDRAIIDRYNEVNPERPIEAVVYRGTIDLVVIDEDGFLWFLDFKTAKQFAQFHYETDPQISSYCWAGSAIYDKPVMGFIYQQHKKQVPEYPRWLKTKNMYSTAANQNTTRTKYREALINMYGDVKNAPAENVEYLNKLAMQETAEGDKYVVRDKIYRSQAQIEAEGAKILLEATDMVNPDLPIYPNPTRDCSWDCPFHGPCIMLDDNGDWEAELFQDAKARHERDENWRNYL